MRGFVFMRVLLWLALLGVVGVGLGLWGKLSMGIVSSAAGYLATFPVFTHSAWAVALGLAAVNSWAAYWLEANLRGRLWWRALVAAGLLLGFVYASGMTFLGNLQAQADAAMAQAKQVELDSLRASLAGEEKHLESIRAQIEGLKQTEAQNAGLLQAALDACKGGGKKGLAYCVDRAGKRQQEASKAVQAEQTRLTGLQDESLKQIEVLRGNPLLQGVGLKGHLSLGELILAYLPDTLAPLLLLLTGEMGKKIYCKIKGLEKTDNKPTTNRHLIDSESTGNRHPIDSQSTRVLSATVEKNNRQARLQHDTKHVDLASRKACLTADLVAGSIPLDGLGYLSAAKLGETYNLHRTTVVKLLQTAAAKHPGLLEMTVIGSQTRWTYSKQRRNPRVPYLRLLGGGKD